MRITLTRARIALLLSVLFAVVALVLGVVLPPAPSGAGASGAAPTLLISEFSETASTIWRVPAVNPANRTRLTRVQHAAGWELEGAVAPDGRRLAYLVLPPAARDPRTQAQLVVTDGSQSAVRATGLDLTAGVVWSTDGTAMFARRVRLAADGRAVFTLVEVPAAEGPALDLLTRDDLFGLFPVGRSPEGPTYAVALTAEGSVLLALDGSRVLQTIALAAGVTRDWRLSPDGATLAFTKQDGLNLQVRVQALSGTTPADATRPDATPAAARPATIGAAQTTAGSAAPAWHPDGSLSVGRFGAGEAAALRVRANGDTSVDATPATGFVLPVAWAPTGDYLAVRAFTGSGPGDVGTEQAAVLTAGGERLPVSGAYVRVLGWWHGGS